MADDHENGVSQRAAVAASPHKFLVGGARKGLVESLVAGATEAGLALGHVVPGMIGPLNVLDRTRPEVYSREEAAVLDIGFRNSSICLLHHGTLVLNRVMPLGGDQITKEISEIMKISYDEAENLKIGMSQDAESVIEMALGPLVQELRACLVYFEHQHDMPVSRIFLTGATSRSPLITQILQKQLVVECEPLKPVNWLEQQLPPQQAVQMESLGPQLAVALGGVLASF
jgi:Tfp pilus assembly PilM family ATPase